ncbi:hypothetical protein EYF80_005741 [Liparis tanakae]|uniref:Uncharacterized protein n=1 Tax=Liparis tanakae TaxID=230148 RepID=A0A4Z2J0S4_9TELE|nr:hypothetical protein EYF80_005741 [Liparis tanakae]
MGTSELMDGIIPWKEEKINNNEDKAGLLCLPPGQLTNRHPQEAMNQSQHPRECQAQGLLTALTVQARTSTARGQQSPCIAACFYMSYPHCFTRSPLPPAPSINTDPFRWGSWPDDPVGLRKEYKRALAAAACLQAQPQEGETNGKGLKKRDKEMDNKGGDGMTNGKPSQGHGGRRTAHPARGIAKEVGPVKSAFETSL